MVDAEAARTQIAKRLPRRVRWTVQGTPLDYDFSAARRPLAPLAADALNCEPEPEWLDLLVFGEYDYAEGGGANPFLGVRPTDGVVLMLDVERDNAPLSVLNSSVDGFIETFLYLNTYLSKGDTLPKDAYRRLRRMDPAVYSQSDWAAFVRYVASD